MAVPSPARTTRASSSRIVRVRFPSDLILDSVDADGKDLLCAGIEVKERGKPNNRTVLFHWPVLADWDQFCQKVAILLKTISIAVGDLHIPDDWQAELEQRKARTHLNVLAGAIRLKLVRDQLTTILPMMDPMVDGETKGNVTDGKVIHGDEAQEWVNRNMTITDYVQALILVTAVPQELEKKTISGLMALFPNLTNSVPAVESPKGSESQSTGLDRSAYSVSEKHSFE